VWPTWCRAAALAGLVNACTADTHDAGQASVPAPVSWVDDLAGSYRRYVDAGPDGTSLFGELPPAVPRPNLDRWRLTFSGGRFLVVEGRPATQLLYTTSDKSLGPVIVVVANSTKPDMSVEFKKSGDVNMLLWRHDGHAYALAGTATVNYLWIIHTDLANQFEGT
jgi:hypothetical protein